MHRSIVQYINKRSHKYLASATVSYSIHLLQLLHSIIQLFIFISYCLFIAACPQMDGSAYILPMLTKWDTQGIFL